METTAAPSEDVNAPRADVAPVRAQLGLWDTVSVIVGIVVGSSLYEIPPEVFRDVPNPWIGLGAWAVGGLLSLIGALVYAELATTYPRQGGDYVYLTRAFGGWAGFLFGWAQLSVVRSGSIGMMAFVFARYAIRLWDLPAPSAVYLAVAAVLALSFVNILGVLMGKETQNVLTVVKIVGLGAILVAGFLWREPGALAEEGKIVGFGFDVGMILILYAYGGWNDAAFVAAELRDRRNIARSLIIGILAITTIYLVVNLAYIMGAGFEGGRHSKAIAADVLGKMLGPFGEKAMCLLVMVSALGAINGIIFTGSRVYASLGTEHPIFAWLGRWHPRLGSPHWALAAQTLFTLLMMVAASGFESGQAAIDTFAGWFGLKPVFWGKFEGGFSILFAATAPVFWIFFLMTGLSYFILRFRDPDIERPFALPLPWNPLLPLIFCATCLYMLYASVTFGEALVVVGVLPVLLGIPLYFVSMSLRRDERPLPPGEGNH